MIPRSERKKPLPIGRSASAACAVVSILWVLLYSSRAVAKMTKYATILETAMPKIVSHLIRRSCFGVCPGACFNACSVGLTGISSGSWDDCQMNR